MVNRRVPSLGFTRVRKFTLFAEFSVYSSGRRAAQANSLIGGFHQALLYNAVPAAIASNVPHTVENARDVAFSSRQSPQF